jgi:hypothetical protein
MAEALAMQHRLSLADHLGHQQVQVESDSLKVIYASSGMERWWSESAAVFPDCVTLVASIGRVEFKQYLREANEVAHEIARFCYSYKSNCNWVSNPLALF